MQQRSDVASTSGRHPSSIGGAIGLNAFPVTLSRRASPAFDFAATSGGIRRGSVCCGSSQSVRFRLQFDPRDHGTAEEARFSHPAAESSSGDGEAAEDGVSSSPPPRDYWKRDQPGEVRVFNRFAQHARMTPVLGSSGSGGTAAGAATAGGSSGGGIFSWLRNPFPGEEYFLVDLERTYSSEWPSVELRDGKAVIRRGFLEPLDDPNAPYMFFYSGVERFTYSLPERAIQAVATSAYAAAHVAAFLCMYAWKPALAAAALVSWLRNSLSVTRWAVLLALAAVDKVWLFWLLLGGKMADGVLEQHAPTLRHYVWFFFKLWVAYTLLTTVVAPVMPLWPFAPGSNGALDYPFPLFRMGQ